MGLERAAAAVQGKPSVYETDLFLPLVQRVCELTGKNYGVDGNVDRAIRVVAEHGRGIAFLIADGLLPSNEAGAMYCVGYCGVLLSLVEGWDYMIPFLIMLLK
jgi:alanyl-tRNA synthetase